MAEDIIYGHQSYCQSSGFVRNAKDHDSSLQSIHLLKKQKQNNNNKKDKIQSKLTGLRIITWSSAL